MRVLTVSHGHPEYNLGGAEVAAYHLHRELQQRKDIRSIHLSRMASPATGSRQTPFATYGRGDSEIMIDVRDFELFNFSTGDRARLITHMTEFLLTYRPEVIHFHHFLGLGLEMFRIVRNVLPDCAIILTLYEYLCICNNNGQMVKSVGSGLCFKSSPISCHRCFPTVSPAAFKRRELFIKSYLELCDRFIASSEFLRQRYIAWGLPAEKIVVIDNGFPRAPTVPPRALSSSNEWRGRFAFFGQLTRWKGADVLVSAFAGLAPEVAGRVSLEIHGANLAQQTKEYQKRLKRLLEQNPQIENHGRYRNKELPRLMSNIDWVVVPSIWWENSPLVLQEAAINGRVPICSDIGGMAEKVRDGVNGLHFRAGNPESLRQVITRAASTPGLWDKLAANLTPGPWIDEIADSTLALYEACLATRRTP